MQQLYEFLRTGSEREALDLLRLIRSSHDLASVIEQLERPTANRNRTLPRPLPNEALRSLDARALRDAIVKVPARPWTIVAGDGIVSHLISQFFDLEHPTIMHHIDRETLIQEMTNADASTAEFCTPLLVNAICAQGTVSCLPAHPGIHLPTFAVLFSLRSCNWRHRRRLARRTLLRRSSQTSQQRSRPTFNTNRPSSGIHVHVLLRICTRSSRPYLSLGFGRDV